ncbi:hypothetical protein KIF59_21215 [Enterobacter cloacae subsp. cloacae]|nr:hypothetical protein [Enterobacter cloacae subsp. cloacae]
MGCSTEMLYMDRQHPAKTRLYNIFCQALESANSRSIIVRTMDIGGDKPVEYLNIPAENNPFSATVPYAYMKSILRCSRPTSGDPSRLCPRKP